MVLILTLSTSLVCNAMLVVSHNVFSKLNYRLYFGQHFVTSHVFVTNNCDTAGKSIGMVVQQKTNQSVIIIYCMKCANICVHSFVENSLNRDSHRFSRILVTVHYLHISLPYT